MRNSKRNPAHRLQSVGFRRILRSAPFWVGIAAAVGIVLLGNLGTVRMIWIGVQRLAAPNGVIDDANIFQQIGWAARGTFSYISGTDLPYSLADWYWKPSRAIQPEAGNEITEFPFFTFLYGDLHAHLIALPVTLLLMACLVSIVFSAAHWRGTQSISGHCRDSSRGVLNRSDPGGATPDQYLGFLHLPGIDRGSRLVRWIKQSGRSIYPSVDWLSGNTRRLLRSVVLAGVIIGLAVIFVFAVQ